MRHLVIGQRQKAPNFSAFHWSPHGCLVTIGQYFVTTRVIHLPKRTKTSLITESDQSRANHQLLQLCTVRTAWSDSDQAVRAVHSCKSWFTAWNGLRNRPSSSLCLSLSQINMKVLHWHEGVTLDIIMINRPFNHLPALRRMDYLRFYNPFKSILIISSRWKGDNDS